MFRLTNLWKFFGALGAILTIIGTGLKLFSFIPGLPHGMWEPAQLWGDVLPLFFGPVALCCALAIYLGINRGPLPGTTKAIDKIVAKVQPGNSEWRWIAVFATGSLIAFGWSWFVSCNLFFPGVFMVMESAWRGYWQSLLWQVPMLATGTIGMSYAFGLYANAFYRSAEVIWPDDEAEGATEAEEITA